jgi:mono/diheme cytochrome c family protein
MMGIPNFTDAAWHQRHNDEKMREIIVKGKGQMPSFKDKLTDDQLQEVIGYIRKFPDQ